MEAMRYRRFTVALAAYLAILTVVVRAVITPGTAAIDVNTAQADCAATITATAGDLVVFGVYNRTNETNTISSIAYTEDGSAGARTINLITGPTDHSGATQRSWFYYIENIEAGSIVITATFDGTIDSACAAGPISGLATSSVLDTSDASPEFKTNTTGPHTTSTLTASASGILVGFLATNGNVTLSSLGSGTNWTNSSTRAHLIYQTVSAGSVSLTATSSINANSTFHSAVFLEPGAAASNGPRCLLLGVC